MRHLARFLREQRDTIVAAWLEQIAALPSSGSETPEQRRDHIPELLGELAIALDASDSSSPALEQVIVEHARERFAHGYDIREVVTEYQLLRRAILDAHVRTRHHEASPDLAMLNEVIDLAIGVSVDCFMAERDRARDIFVSILGHDLRSPLQAISVAAGILAEAERAPPSVLINAAGRMQGSVKRMSEMIDGLLDFARTHFGGGIPINPQPCDLQPVLRDVVDELAVANAKRQITFTALAAEIPATVDATRIAQAVTNLVRNAVEHGADPIIVTTADEGELLRIDVSSAGTLSADAAARLFKPFSHVKRERRSGLGLGLFIVAEIARAHGGTAWLASSDDGRVVFSFRIRRRVGGD